MGMMPKATPKARLFQMYPFGKGLTFVTESVPTSSPEDVPGSISYFKPNQAVSYRCTLSLPDGTQVISDLFQRKKDAEHNASQRALDQMQVPTSPSLEVLSSEEKWENLRRRIQETFSDKNVLSYMPLREHFKVALHRKGLRYGQVPVSAIIALDAKISTLCKIIDRRAETDPVCAISLLCKAVVKCSSLKLDVENLCISRTEPFSPDVVNALLTRKKEPCPRSPESVSQEERVRELRFRAVHIPSSADTAVSSSDIVLQQEYYLDVLAQRIGLQDGSRLAMSRPIGKTHPVMRLYWAVPDCLPELRNRHSDIAESTVRERTSEASSPEDLRRYCMRQQDDQAADQEKNIRASLLMGYPVYGDVLLAAVGSDWRSCDIYSADVTLSYYYRVLMGRFPQGNYKLSRGAIVASNLPLSFSSRLQWKGMSPRGLLIEFCQHHRLPEPEFIVSYPGSECQGHADVNKKVPESAEMKELDEAHGNKSGENEPEDLPGDGQPKIDDDNQSAGPLSGPYFCTVKVEFQKGSVTVFESGGARRNRHDAIQSCALQAVHCCRTWFERSLTGSYEPVLPWVASGDVDGDLSKLGPRDVSVCASSCSWEPYDQELFEQEAAVDGSQTGKTPPPGATVTVRYTVRWFKDVQHAADVAGLLIEKNDGFMFEMGIDAVVADMESVVADMSVGDTLCFFTSPDATHLLFAASDDLPLEDGQLTPEQGKLKHTIQLLRYNEPPEERMEAALFKPSLSKQRLGCALSIIQKVQAKTLIDLGCGSGSLMENLLEECTGLEVLMGVDISSKSLVRAAKVLSAKIMEDQPGKDTLKTLTLYEGSIADFNPELQGVDVAVCIEVVEHMDPEPLSMFGITILGKLQPQVLIVSTPNFEYNPILQGFDWDPSTNSIIGAEKITDSAPKTDMLGESGSHTGLESMEKRIRLSNSKDAPTVHCSGDGKQGSTQQVKLRNEDHRFEWTRAEFRSWATTMAKEYRYKVTFDGVGGSGEEEGPGFASQIAIFTRCENSLPYGGDAVNNTKDYGGRQSTALSESVPHRIVWQWMPVEQQSAK